MAKRVLDSIALVLLVLSGAGCIQNDGTRWSPLAPLGSNSDDQERDLGMQFDRELLEQVRVIDDPVVTGFLHDLGHSIVRQIEPQPFIYRFRLIIHPELNAFAVPGGYVYFHTATLLEAGSLDELAGVMGHEVAHINARHYARMRQKSQIPDLLTNIALLAAAVATGEPGVLITGAAANVALKLSFSRGFEAEADEIGSVYMARAGFDPSAISYFFERILEGRDGDAAQIPPYLFTHPEVGSRIETARTVSRTLRPVETDHRDLERSFRRAQGRLAWLLESKHQVPSGHGITDGSSEGDLVVAEASGLIAAGRFAEALDALEEQAEREPGNPRLYFRRGEVLSALNRHDEAITAFRQTIELDPSRAQVFYQLGLAYKAIGDRQRAVYALEQALMRAGERGVVRQRAEWEVLKLNFGVLSRVGFADGEAGDQADTPAGFSKRSFHQNDTTLAWWAQLTPRFVPYAKQIRVRWRDPSGQIVQERKARSRDRVYLISRLSLEQSDPSVVGEWRVEALLRGELVDSRLVRVERTRAADESPDL